MPPIGKRARLWIALALGLLVLSIVALGVRVTGYREPVPLVSATFFDDFLEPGTAVWWMTIGKVFQAFPSDFTGYVVVSVANAALWTLACWLVAAIGKLAVRASRRLRSTRMRVGTNDRNDRTTERK
jgi:hypothetical protein